MGKALGVLLLGASLSAATYGWMSLEETFDQAPGAPVVAINSDTVAQPQPRIISSGRSFATATPTAAVARDDGKAPAGAAATVEAPPGVTVVADSRPKAEALASPIPVVVPRPQAANDEARRALARDIQKELKRVGCYDGDVDGQWNSVTRKAMGAFNERVNASLPVEAPDFILLTLVQGHTARACGRLCPAGQALSGDNRCLPRALLSAKAAAPKQPVAKQVATVQGPVDAASVAPEGKRPKAAPPPLPGRMAIGAPAETDLVNEKARKEAEARRKAEQAAIEARRARLEAERKARLEAEQKSTVATDAAKAAELASLEERRARLEAERKARIASGPGPAGGMAPAVMSSLGGPPPAPAPKAAAAKTQSDDDAAADAKADASVAAAAAAARIAAARTQAAAKAARLQRERDVARRRYAGPVFMPPMYATRPPVPRPAVTVYPRRSTGSVFSSIARNAP